RGDSPVVLTDAILFASLGSMALNILWVALGLGLVIFFHELGHFAVAKWCNVCVERFSIGLGRVLWSFKWGETEYAFSMIPFGGYVKMLGQDDMDPSQLTSEEIAEDPRSYSAKSVPQRMAIISAGVIMNVITGALFYSTAFGIGLERIPSTVGGTRVESPAWQAGLLAGDRITKINDREVVTFSDIQRNVALSRGDIVAEGVRADGKTKLGPLTITPDGSGTRRVIGVVPALGVTLFKPPGDEEVSVTLPGSPAAKAKPAFQPGDVIRRIGETDIPDFPALRRVLAQSRSREVTFHVQRDGSTETEPIVVKANAFRTLGLWMEIGEVSAVRDGSPAARAGLKPGDRITEVNGRKLGHDVNPLRLPDDFENWRRERKTVTVKVLRKGGKEVPLSVEFRKDDPLLYAWTEQPSSPGVPLSVPSLGVAIHMIPTVIKVDSEKPAGKAGIKPQDRLTSLTLTLPKGAPRDGLNKNEDLVVKFGEKDKHGREQHNWAYAFWMMQTMATREVILEYKTRDGESKSATMTPQRDKNWFLPVRGIRPGPDLILQQASDPLNALKMGFQEAKDSLTDVYLTIVSLFGGRLSPKELSGPVGIATVAYTLAQQGLPALLLFLGFLSMNLAVLNFLPIPVLDGGHMVFLGWEAVTGKKPSEKVVIGATYAGVAFLVGLMLFVLFLDIDRFFH
ncbi:MAG: site-2 protease family protein, partial [Planctomycetaceae bacterium]